MTNTREATSTPGFVIGSTMVGDDDMVMNYVPAGEFLMGGSVLQMQESFLIPAQTVFFGRVLG